MRVDLSPDKLAGLLDHVATHTALAGSLLAEEARATAEALRELEPCHWYIEPRSTKPAKFCVTNIKDADAALRDCGVKNG